MIRIEGIDMNTHRRTISAILLTVLFLTVIGSLTASPVAAQDTSGWYGPFDDGATLVERLWPIPAMSIATVTVTLTRPNKLQPRPGGMTHTVMDAFIGGTVSAYTGDVDCNGDGYADTAQQDTYAAGWYDANGDGCLYWWDGAQYTGDVDCDGDGYADSAGGSNAASGAAAGWYGPFDDGCNYWWDGTQYTSDVDCNGDGYLDVAAEQQRGRLVRLLR